jgi:hypothetical protein
MVGYRKYREQALAEGTILSHGGHGEANVILGNSEG